MVMKHAIVAVFAVGVIAAAASTSWAATLVGMHAPRFALATPSGGNIFSSQFGGTPVFLNFFETWCAPCKQELPVILRSYPRYAKHVRFIGVDEQESPAVLASFVTRAQIPYAVGIDEGSAAAHYGVYAIPVSIFIDRSGIVRAVHRGALTAAAMARAMALIDRAAH
jgi:thiol-disulfide isomerase/thioredoxin